jgi:hypothetical protein
VNSSEGTPKKLVFTESLRNICMAWFGIREADLRDALEAPDKKQSHQFDDLTLGFYTKRHQRSGIEAYLLVCTQKTEEHEIVHQAFWASPDLTGGLNVLEPLILLQQLAGRFGLALRVGNQLNKFIFRETITISGPVNAGPVVEIINPEDHTCAPFFFFKTTEDGNSHHIHCALAFCIDIDVYTRGLTRAQPIEDISFQIAPQLQGHVTPQSLISPRGTLEFQMNYNQLGEGILFRIKSTDYYLEVGFTPTHFYILRNEDALKRILQPVYMPAGPAHFFAIWEPTQLRLIVLDETFDAALASEAEREQAVRERTSILDTRAAVPPFSLINAARKLSLLPIKQYGSREEVYQHVASALDTIPDKVTTTDMWSAFWNNDTKVPSSSLGRQSAKPRSILQFMDYCSI